MTDIKDEKVTKTKFVRKYQLGQEIKLPFDELKEKDWVEILLENGQHCVVYVRACQISKNPYEIYTHYMSFGINGQFFDPHGFSGSTTGGSSTDAFGRIAPNTNAKSQECIFLQYHVETLGVSFTGEQVNMQVSVDHRTNKDLKIVSIHRLKID